MARVTNRVDWSTLRDLVVAPPRATLAWEREDGLGLAPVRYRCAGGRHRVALEAGAVPREGARASLVLDDGWPWFALRAVTIRGTLSPCPPPPGAGGSGVRWLELRPERITAWDYGRLHEEAAP